MAKLRVLPFDALIVVDMQNDFMPGGALPVPNALTIIPTINRYVELFEKVNATIVFTRDWHPKNHASFKSRGGPWPPHCIQNTYGAELHPDLMVPKSAVIISKAFKEDEEAYSGFKGIELESKKDLNSILRSREVKRVFVSGVATEYCVKATALDAVDLGYQVFLLVDAVKGINQPPGSEEQAVNEMLAKGVVAITINDITLL
jgi:nicotinamidase/pyrazinamidase